MDIKNTDYMASNCNGMYEDKVAKDERLHNGRCHQTTERNTSHEDDGVTIESTQSDTNHKKLQGTLTLWLALSTIAVSVGCGCQTGYNGSGISVPAPFIREFINQTNYSKWDGSASDLIQTWIYSVTVTMFAFGATLGSMLSGTLSDVYGRKKSLLFGNILSFIGALCMGLCQVADIYGLLVLGRFIVGIYSGLTYTTMSVYLAEISPINLRGSIGVFSSLCRASGTLIAHILGFAFFYSQERFPIMLALTGCFSVFNFLLFPFCPESPRWLYITQNRSADAIKALKQLRGHNTDVSAEIEEMQAESAKNKHADDNQKIDTIEILKFKRPEWKMALILGSIVQMGVQLSGFSTVMMYTTDIYESAGMGMREIAYSTVGLSSLNVVMTGISVFIVDRFGRRPLLLFPFGFGIVSLLGLTVFINQQENYEFMKWMTLGVIYLYVSTFSLGPASIKNLIAAELWLQDARPAAMSIIMQINWWSTVFMNLTFPVLEGAMGSYVYLLYTICFLTATTILAIYLPETKQRTFDEIVSSLLRKKTPIRDEVNPSNQNESYEMEATCDNITMNGHKPIDLHNDFEVLTALPSPNPHPTFKHHEHVK